MGRIRESRARLLIMQVILGLEALHDAGILYRDLKPENILLNDKGHAQIADFGLAKFLPKLSRKDSASGSESRKSMGSEAAGKGNGIMSFLRRRKNSGLSLKEEASTSGDQAQEVWGTTKTRCGTPAYQAPEIVMANEGHVHGLEADWWALGILSYEIMVGEPPFMAQSIKEVYELILKNEIQFPKRMGVVTCEFISALTKKERKERLGYGRSDAAAVKAHEFFKSERSIPWETVASGEVPPPLDLSDAGLASPKDAVFFHAEYTSEDVREFIPPQSRPTSHSAAEFKEFTKVPNQTFQSFTSTTPVAVIAKGEVVDEDKDKN